LGTLPPIVAEVDADDEEVVVIEGKVEEDGIATVIGPISR
jgi:hypothetical protein